MAHSVDLDPARRAGWQEGIPGREAVRQMTVRAHDLFRAQKTRAAALGEKPNAARAGCIRPFG